MDLTTAIQIFEFNDFRDITREELKKRYRKLAMKHHPDHGGDAEKFKVLNDANSLLLSQVKLFERIKKIEESQKVRSAIISLQGFLDLFHGKTFKFSDGYILKRGNINSNRLFIEIPFTVTIDSYTKQFSEIMLRQVSDKYEVYADIPDADLSAERDLKVQVLDKTINIKLAKSSIICSFNLEGLVEIKVIVSRIPFKADEDSNN